MAIPWTKTIQQTGELSYYLDASIKGSWSVAAKGAVKTFNALCVKPHLGVVFTASNKAMSERDGVAVRITVGDGKVTSPIATAAISVNTPRVNPSITNSDSCVETRHV